MTMTMPARELDRLSLSGLTTEDLPELSEDLTGRTLLDRLGQMVGSVADVMIDAERFRAPFLLIGSGGLLGLGRQFRLIPRDAIARVEEDAVYIDRDKDLILSGPVFKDDLTGDEAERHYADVYTHYGITPYWVESPLGAGASDEH